jgi:imidazolonepropionase-like amidohydrolase
MKRRGLPLSFVMACLLMVAGCTTKNPEPGAIAIIRGTLIDGTGAAPLPKAVVIIKEGRIAAVGSQPTLKAPRRAVVLDAKGATILPGFINSHVHKSCDETTLAEFAQAGVTTVRELCYFRDPYTSETWYSVRDSLNKNPKNARLVLSGPHMVIEGGFAMAGHTGSAFVKTPEDAIREGNRILDEGADALKVFIQSYKNAPVMPVEVARAIIETAHARGKKAPVHTVYCRDTEIALQAGADSLAHMVIDELSADLAGRIAKAGIIWIPTMEVFKGSGEGAHMVSNLRTFVEAGGTVALGTDYGGYYMMKFDRGMPVKEIRWMQEAGMTPMQIIVAATLNAAKACGIEKDTGTVEAGKAADLLVVDGNPLSNLDALTNVRWVIHAGTVIREP